MSLGSKLKKLRMERGLGQKEVAEALGVPNNTLCNWEKDNNVPRKVTLEKISDYYNVSVDYLLKDSISKQSTFTLPMTETIVQELINKNVNPDKLDDNTKLLIINAVIHDMKEVED